MSYFSGKSLKLMPSDAFISAQNAPKCVWQPGFARTRWGSSQRSPRLPSWIQRREGKTGPILYPDLGDRSPCIAKCHWSLYSKCLKKNNKQWPASNLLQYVYFFQNKNPRYCRSTTCCTVSVVILSTTVTQWYTNELAIGEISTRGHSKSPKTVLFYATRRFLLGSPTNVTSPVYWIWSVVTTCLP